jgi:hypothetical protein
MSCFYLAQVTIRARVLRLGIWGGFPEISPQLVECLGEDNGLIWFIEFGDE